MTKVRDIFRSLCEIAPLDLQMSFDNAGFQLGRAEREVHRVLMTLDVSDAAVAEAHNLGAELIISHHPLLFHPLRSVTDTNAVEKRVLYLLENRIAVISMHTNLDIAEGGVNDVLIRLLGAEPEKALDPDGCGRVGSLPEPLALPDFLARCKERLQVQTLRYCPGTKPVSRLAVMGGSGADSLEAAVACGCDTYVTADIKYHQFQCAAELDLTLIDADHFYTENPVIPDLAQKLRKQFPDVGFCVSQRHTTCIRFA